MFKDINFDSEYAYLLYIGQINRAGYQLLTNLLEKNKKNTDYKKAYLILITNGGDADAGYRIARALGHYYPDDLKVFIPDVCKSAGTLIAIGAKTLVISNRGELGPLDVQLAKKEELFEMSSGLDVMKSLQVLKSEVQQIFKEILIDFKFNTKIGTKLAAKLASEMASNIISPITSQIDPLRIGEHHRALIVARDYGKRLSKKFQNIKEENIDMLTLGYPSHSFVIDRKEASTLFNNVRGPNENEVMLESRLRDSVPISPQIASGNPIVCCPHEMINNEIDMENKDGKTNQKHKSNN